MGAALGHMNGVVTKTTSGLLASERITYKMCRSPAAFTADAA